LVNRSYVPTDGLYGELQTLAKGGLTAALGTLHPAVSYGDGTLRYATGSTTNSTWLAVNALTLMPLASESDRILANEDHPDATIIAYAARGSAELWEQTASPSRELALVLGQTRATIARALELPTTTSDLAARL
jgi:hypothetical protein